MRNNNYLRLQNEKIQTRAIPVVPNSYDDKTHSFECVAATEERVQVMDWERWAIVDEILLMSGYRAPKSSPDKSPLLDTHMRFSIDMVLGSARDWRVENDKLICRSYLSSVEEGAKAETKIREGHIDSVSIGYTVDQSVWIEENTTATVNGRQFTGPLKVATQWTRRELSLVPLGADEFAKFRSARALQLGLPENASDEEIRKQLNNTTPQFTRKVNTMTPEELAAKQAEIDKRIIALEEETRKQNTAFAEKQKAVEITQREAEDAKEIMATASRFAQTKGIYEMAAKAIEEKRSAKDFMKEVLEKVGNNPTPTNLEEGNRAPVLSMNSFIKPWQRRSVKYLNTIVLEKKGSDRGTALRKELNEEIVKMSDVQKNDELREAAQIITSSGISQLQQMRLMSSLTDGAGKYLVPTPLLAEIFVLVEKWGVARRYFRPIPMTAETLKLDTLATEAIAYWTTQGSNITAADLAFGQGTLTAYKLAAITSWSSELPEDSAIALLPVVIDSIARAIKKKEDLAAFIGDGSGTYAAQTGLLNYAGNVVTMDDGKTSITDANAIDYKNLRDAVNIDFRDGAMYFLSPACVSALEGLKDLQGRFIYREPAGALPATLWGSPIADNVGINALTQTSSAALKFAAFGNPKYMLMGMRREIEILASREGVLDSSGTISFNALQADGEILRVTERIGIKGVLASGLSVLKTAAA